MSKERHEARPPVTRTTHPLPFDKLRGSEFERLCSSLVRLEHPNAREVTRLGEAGTEQGRDITAVIDGKLWAWQAKNVARFTKSTAALEIDKILSLPDRERPHDYVFLVRCAVRANTRTAVESYCEARLRCRILSGSDLDEAVKRHGDILREFFDLRDLEATRTRLYNVPSALRLKASLGSARPKPRSILHTGLLEQMPFQAASSCSMQSNPI